MNLNMSRRKNEISPKKIHHRVQRKQTESKKRRTKERRTLGTVASFTAFAALTFSGAGALAADTGKRTQAPAAGTYTIDAAHSSSRFEVPHLVISSVEGRFQKVSGKIKMKKDFRKSSVTAEIPVASINTGVAKRDEHLRSKDFFDVKRFPQMRFVSTKIEGGPSSFKMHGKLTMKGKSRKVTFKGKYLGSVVDGYGAQKLAFVAETKINRKKFGLTWGQMVEAGPVVGDEITIALKVQASK